MRLPGAWRSQLLVRKAKDAAVSAASVVENAITGPSKPQRYRRLECLTWQHSENVLEVALHRGPCNEIGTTMLSDLEVLTEYLSQGAGGARAVLFYSEMPKGFCAGADLKELHAGLLDNAASGSKSMDQWRAATSVRSFLDRIHNVFNTIDGLPIPTIAVLHGFVFGGGFEFALACDLLIAEESARFAFPELRLGLIPGFGGIPRLRRDVGNAVIRDVLLTGRSLNAKRAHALGLVSQCVPRGRGLRAARSMAQQTCRFDALTTSRAKAFCKPIPYEELEAEKLQFLEMLASPVVTQALAQFVESTSVRPYLPESK